VTSNLMTDWQFAAIGLGGNLGDAPATLCFALEQLAAHEQIQLADISPLYRSAPVGPAGQPDYANAVAVISTNLSPEALLSALQDIEQKAGRQRLLRWGARTLDLDLLLYADISMLSPRLTIPHSELCNRAFVLVPLHDIVPNLILPNGQVLALLTASCCRQGLAIWHDTRWPQQSH
jgi:2-amino-4-hydroxy-6-hydroxymethyldihydropteridine diphosphokinase